MKALVEVGVILSGFGLAYVFIWSLARISAQADQRAQVMMAEKGLHKTDKKVDKT